MAVPSLPSLRVVTYNVQRFGGRRGPSTFMAIASALAGLEPRPAIVCLNEVGVRDPLAPCSHRTALENLGLGLLLA